MNIAIANNGSNIEASWGHPPHVHSSGDDRTPPPPLKAQLEAAMCTTLPLGAGDPARSFLPNDELHRLVTPASALRTLREGAPGFTEEIRSIFAQTIFKKSPALIKTFAILVLIGRADAIFKFMDNAISDGDLPLELTTEGSTVVRSLSAPKYFDLELAGLNYDDVVAFEEMQWRVCVPVMDELGAEGEPRLFHSKTILPFVWDGPVAPVIQQGGHSRVYQVRIHPAHLYCGASESRTHFAVKQFESSLDTGIFEREISALRRFRNAPNISPFLTAFKHGSTPYLVLPWADNDLQSLLTQSDAPKDERQAALTVKQMLGIAEALKAIHYWRVKSRNKAAGCSAGAGHGYHGDLKPENILVMDGRWKLADFGLSSVRQQAAATTEQRPLGFSPTYRAPEHDGGHFDGQQADMWSLGCVMSVAATWMALGRKGVRSFRAKRALRGDIATRENGKVDDSFFEAREKKKGSGLRVKPAVTHWIDKLHQSPTASPLIHDILDLVKNGMLEVDGDKRITSAQLVDRLREIHRKCSDEPEYAKPDPHATNKAVVPKKIDHAEAPRSISVNMMRLPYNHGTWPLDSHQLAPPSFNPEPDGRSSTWAAPEQSFGDSILGLGSDLAVANQVFHTIPMASPKSPRGKRRRDAESRSPAQSKRQKSASPRSPIDKPSGELFACPYFKHDQEKYGTKEWNSCGGPGWEIHRLKEHLKRVHRVKGHRCNCCLQRWSSLKGLSEHQRSDVHCIKQEDTGDDSIDETQWGKIQERNRGMEGATKWTEIYKTIFPLDAVPSPCKFTREGGYEVWPCD
ncbi:hypothetical protein Brms1b_009422 [Colletotrichum noveboracense]|nr:hypothetical protein Brms1b_009422 [Colletotrichum noveboracense]